jgi:hypothetical protein
MAARPKRRRGQKEVTKERIKENEFSILKSLQTIEFKYKFELEHFETMHQPLIKSNFLKIRVLQVYPP